MARPVKKRGFRPVVVDGVRYRWRSDGGNRTADIEIHREAETSARGQRLCVYLVGTSGGTMAVTGKVAAIAIHSALAKGWTPQLPAKDYRLNLKWPISG